MAEQLAALSALLGQQLEAEGWGGEAAAAAVLAAGGPGQLEPLLQVGVRACAVVYTVMCSTVGWWLHATG